MSRWLWIVQMIYWHAGTVWFFSEGDYLRTAACGVAALVVWTLRDPFERSLRGRILCRMGMHAFYRDWGTKRCRRCGLVCQIDGAPIVADAPLTGKLEDICPKNYGHPHDYSLTDDGSCCYCGHDEEPPQ